MRQEAWGIMTGSKWGWRILVNYAVLGVIAVAVVLALAYAYRCAGIQTWESFKEAQKAAEASGITLAVPSSREAMRMTLASGFSNFVGYLFQGIVAFGLITTLVKCIRNESERWFADAFGGFRRPFGLLWLTALMTLKIFLWTLLFVIPGIIAAFRYALAWYVKAEDPEMGANACLKRSGEIMKGRKLRLFLFSLSYIGWILLAFLPLVAASLSVQAMVGDALVETAILVGGIIAFIVLGSFVFVYGAIGQAVFYRDAKAEADSAPANVST
jgi:hypothetical protein